MHNLNPRATKLAGLTVEGQRTRHPDVRNRLGRRNRRLELLGMAVRVTLLTSTWNAVRLLGMSLFDVLVLASLPGLCLSTLSSSRLRLERRLVARTCYLLLAIAVVQTITVQHSYAAFGDWFRAGLAFAAVPLFVFLAVARYWSDLISRWFLASCVVNAFVALVLPGGVHAGPFVVYGSAYGWIDRSSGLTTHPNHLGFILAAALPLAYFQIARTRQRDRLAALLATAMIVAGILASGSRTAIAMAILAGGVAFWRLRGRHFANATFLICAMIVVSASLWASFKSRLPYGAQRLLDPTGTSASESDLGRHLLLDESLARVSHHPFFGSGVRFARDAHNSYLQLLELGGVVFLVPFLLTVFAVLRRLMADRRPDSTYYLMVLTGIVFGWATSNIVLERYLSVPMALVFAYANATNIRDPSGPNARPPRP